MSRRTILDHSDVFERGLDSPRFFVFSDSFRRALLQLVDRFSWESAWTEALTDENHALIEDGIRALIEGDEMTITIDFQPQITVTSSGGAASGGGCSSPPAWENVPGQCYPIEPIPTDPDGGWEAPVQPPDVTDEEWEAQRCAVANYAYEQILIWLERVSQVTTQLGTVAVILFFLWAIVPGTALVALIGGTLLTLASTFAQWVAYLEPLDEIFDYILSWWVDNRDEIVCKFYNATNAQVLQQEVVSDLLSDLLTYAQSRPWWFSQMEELIQRMGVAMLAPNLFLAPLRLVPPAGYVGATNCSSCGGTPPSEGDAWAVEFGIAHDPSVEYTNNTEEEHELSVSVSGSGAGGSIQQGFDYLIQLSEEEIPDAEDLAFTAVTFTLSGSISANAGNAATRQLRYGQPNEYTLLWEEVNGNGEAASLSDAGTIYGLRLATHDPLGTDVEFVVPDKRYLRPRFIFNGVGYGLTRTDWEILVETFTMIP